MKSHQYQTTVRWTGNSGKGTETYRSYERSYTIHSAEKTPITGSADPAFRGDPTKYNPEELLLAALSSCHMLSFLHCCTKAGVYVEAYTDDAQATMEETAAGGGHFISATLHPQISLRAPAPADLLARLHHEAGALCFIAASCNFPIHHEPVYTVANEKG